MITVKNIFENTQEKLKEECIEDLISTGNFKLEKIVSQGHSSPDNFWYNQDTNEFVLLVSGSAQLEFENEPSVQLKPGDYLIIPSHKKHRVSKTEQNQKTFWLALHY